MTLDELRPVADSVLASSNTAVAKIAELRANQADPVKVQEIADVLVSARTAIDTAVAG